MTVRVIRRRWATTIQLVVLMGLGWAGGAVRTGWASRPRLLLERVDASACRNDRIIRVYAAELELEGTLRKRPYADYRLVRDRVTSAARPVHAETFELRHEPWQLALVIQATAAYQQEFATIVAELQRWVARLPQQAKLSLVAYGEQPRSLLRSGSREQAQAALRQLHCAEDEHEAALLAAVRIATQILAVTATDQRKVMLLISDGVDRQPDWDSFRAAGRRAAAQGVAIMPLAYSPSDERGPLLNLGELAKRSAGTLRWVRSRQQWSGAFDALADELDRQLVLSFQDTLCERPATMQLAAGDLLSNPYSYVPSKPSGQLCAADSQRWKQGWFIAVGLLLGVLGLIGATRWLLRGLGDGKR